MSWILLVLSVPFFYIIGVVSFIQWIIGRNKKSNFDRTIYLEKAIEDLEEELKKDPTKKVAELLDHYKKEVIVGRPDVVHATQAEETHEISESHETQSLENVWQNWYSDNSINLLLYIGAFFIVASASIFVSFQWEAITGTMKSILISLLTLSFFISGLYFYKMPKIKNAGGVFTIIGALLIPFCGAAWYNFALKDTGTPQGLVWLFTSLISLGVYILLAITQKNKFYSYAASISSISLCLSFVNTYDLNNDFYILAGILSSLSMLLSSIAIKRNLPQYHEIFVKPLELTSNITLPLSLLFGLITAVSSDKLFSIEASVSIFLAAFYYYLYYLITKKALFVALVEILFPFSVLTLFKFLGVPTEFILYMMGFLAIVDIYFSYLFKKNTLTEESDASLFLGQTKLIIIFLFTLIFNLAAFHQIIFSVLCATGAIAISHLKNKIQFQFITALFLAITLLIFNNRILMMDHYYSLLSIIYLLVGTSYFGLTYLYKRSPNYLQTFSCTSAFFFLLAIIFSITSQNYLTINSFVIGSVAILGAYLFSKEDLIYVSNLFLYFTVINVLRINHSQIEFYPISFVVLNFGLFAASLALSDEWRKRYRLSSLAGSLATPIIFGIYSANQFYSYSASRPENILQRYALGSAYAATILFALDTYINKARLEYFTSAVGMATLLWQIKFLGINEVQWYTAPLGIYFMVLAYLRKLKDDFSNQQGLDYIGMFFLLVPTIFQAFSENGFSYALLLGGEGVALIILSITLQNMRYRYGAISALVISVLSQTYSYLFSLPRWLITGLAGLIFLAVAIYLLLKRTVKPEDPKE